MRTASPGWVEHPESSAVPTCVQYMASMAVRLLLLRESRQHKNCTISLDWAVAIPTAPPVVHGMRICPKRVAAAFLLTVDVLFARDVVDCVYRTPRTALYIDRADPSALIVWHVLGVAHHWNMSSFSPQHSGHSTRLI